MSASPCPGWLALSSSRGDRAFVWRPFARPPGSAGGGLEHAGSHSSNGSDGRRVMLQRCLNAIRPSKGSKPGEGVFSIGLDRLLAPGGLWLTHDNPADLLSCLLDLRFSFSQRYSFH